MTEAEERAWSATDIAHHLACRHLTQLERRRRAGTLEVPFVPDARLAAMRERGLEHERRYVDALREQGLRVIELTGNRDPQRTLQAMRDGADAIVQAALGDGSLQGIADVLRRVSTASALGDYSYEPVDTKLTSETKAGTLLQLCTYAVLLEQVQGLRPEHVHVVTPTASETFRTDEFGAYFRLVRAQLTAAVAADPPPATYPNPCAHCDVCRYWQHCAEQRKADDHLSLVAGLSALHQRECERQGIRTMAQLAAIEGELPEPPERGSIETYRRLGQQARLQVEARDLQLPPVERLPIEAGRGFLRLPPPSPGDVFLDFEGDPFVGTHGREYLTGWTHGERGAQRYHQHWAFRDGDEKAALAALLDFVTAARAQHPGMHIYHFGAYEPAALKRLCARHDTHQSVLDELLRGELFVDLHTVVREALRIGVDRYGLKQLEPLHGFERAFALEQAARACRHLELALELGRADDIDEALRQEVAAYNREDCESTASLRDWLEAQRQAAIDAGCEVPRPEPRSPEASEQVSARDERIAALKQALVAGIPDDPEARDPDQRARALLASMLGYFRQEEKNAWWEHFRLRELPREDRLAEREMLAELEFVEELRKQPRQRNRRRVFRYPPQETAIDPDDTVYYTADDDPADEPNSTTLTVADIDVAGCTVTFSMNEQAAAAPPTAVFRKQVRSAIPLEDSLLAFAEHVAQHGFDAPGAYAAACDLLRRLPPRRRERTGEAIQVRGADAIAATTDLCLELDGGVLPVQGPPGSGKSHTGARAIVALAKAGKRVGITAVSHKVIDNLLEKVVEAAAEANVPIRALHLHKGTPPDGVEYTKNNKATLAAIASDTVVGGTAWLWSHEDAIGKLDHLFVDEAGQMSLAQTLAAARAARNLVLLGDPQQLEQPSRGAHPDGADVAALSHIVGPDRATLDPQQGLFLDTTWRLPPAICSFTSELYYDGKLAPHADCAGQRIDGTGVVDGAGLFLREVEHTGNQASSPEEVEAIARFVQTLLQADATWTDRKGETHPLTADEILVIAPYNAQVGALRRALAPFRVSAVGTVDKFQGQEAPLVLYSCTSSSAEDAPRGMSFLYDPHRLNVASSRAQCGFVMFASPALFAPDVRTPEQMRQANGMCRLREVARVLGV